MDLLILRKLAVGGDDSFLRLFFRSTKEQDGDGLGSGRGQQRYDCGGLNAGLRVQRHFYILGMNVDAGWRDDDLALTPDKAKLAFFVALGEVAGGEPF